MTKSFWWNQHSTESYLWFNPYQGCPRRKFFDSNIA